MTQNQMDILGDITHDNGKGSEFDKFDTQEDFCHYLDLYFPITTVKEEQELWQIIKQGRVKPKTQLKNY